MNKVYLGLGGNIGDVVASMLQALADLETSGAIKLVAKSHLYKTPPWGDVNQDDFINSCVEISTSLVPLDLLAALKAQEMALKRTDTRRWGPRTIDMDILLYSEIQFSNEKLIIPHPRMTERAFVLMPLCDLDSDIVINEKTASQWLGELATDDIIRLNDQAGWVSGTV